MNIPYTRAPHQEGASGTVVPSGAAPNAALLIDFDNVTMGMRSDLSKELKNLMSSDIIKGKVTVQRAYADWRRYPQYIVPLSEASIDLIFAPAYGSSKKNATDIRMAIDGMELVFIRPEIGTYILLTGDSDFSSLVLKLKEYGKYVIGVGIQESSSDILVQNCDEYYSYTSLTGLRKTGTDERNDIDPWVLVEKALEQMKRRGDVMRSDRLKQVMLEIDSGFDEKTLGFSKFSRFITEAAKRNLMQIRKLENGQYEISQSGGGSSTSSSSSGKDRGGRGGRSSRNGSSGRSRDSSRKSSDSDRGRGDSGRKASDSDQTSSGPDTSTSDAPPTELVGAYELMIRAVDDLLSDSNDKDVRDSDVKRRMLAIRSGFDEAEMGFSKFSRFLAQADDDGVIRLSKSENGNFRVAKGPTAPSDAVKSKQAAASAAKPDTSSSGTDSAQAPSEVRPRVASPDEAARSAGRPVASSTPAASDKKASDSKASDEKAPGGKASDGKKASTSKARSESTEPSGRRLRPRLSSRRGGGGDEPPPLLEGQMVGAVKSKSEKAKSEKPKSQKAKSQKADSGTSKGGGKTKSDRGRGAPKSSGSRKKPAARRGGGRPSAPGLLDLEVLGLPTDRDSVIQYLSNSYKGVGKKTAESLVDAVGNNVFEVIHTDADRVREVLTPSRAEKVMEGWEQDYERRTSE